MKPGAVHEAKGTVGAFIITEAAPPPREARLRDHLLASCVSALAVKSVVLGSNTKCKAGAKKLAHPACVFPHSTCVATRGYSTNGEIANKLAAVSGVAVTQVARALNTDWNTHSAVHLLKGKRGYPAGVSAAGRRSAWRSYPCAA